MPGGTVLLARDDAFPDALAAAGLAGVLDAPVLLTSADRLPEDTRRAIARAGAERVLLLGGERAIPAGVAGELDRDLAVERIEGSDRFETAAAIARAAVEAAGEGHPGGETVFVVRGDEFADALAAGSPAFAGGHPILLTRRGELPPATAAVLDDLAPRRALVLGGRAAVGDGVVEALAARGLDVRRIAGADRTATAAALADHLAETSGSPLEEVVLARGDAFPDALAAGPLAGAAEAPILLAQAPDRLGEPTSAWLAGRCPGVRAVRAVGGAAALAPETADAAHQARLACRPLPHPLEITYSVEVEDGVASAGEEFVRDVEALLGREDGWTLDGAIALRRVAEGGDFRVRLATAASVEDAHPACDARRSCRVADVLWVNDERWREPAGPYAGRLGDWRRWQVDHLTGHWLGLDRSGCPATGANAPVMLDQGDDLRGCVASPRPSPAERAWVTRRHLAPLAAAFGGDVHGEGRVAQHLRAGGNPLAAAAPLLASADLAVVNLETAVGTRGRPQPGKTFTFRAPPALLPALAGAGVDVVSLANNHALDYGVDALLETIDRARAAGLEVTGAGRDSAEAYAPALVEVGRRTVAVVGLSRVLPAGWAAGPSRPGVASAHDVGAAVRAVEEADPRADLVVVAIHWGVEGATCPAAHQLDLASRLVAAGADVIAGHHPHVLQGIERQDSALVAYSLGNFVWYHSRSPSNRTGVWTVTLDGRGATADAFAPALVTAPHGGPVPVDGALARAIRDEVRQRSPGGGACRFP